MISRVESPLIKGEAQYTVIVGFVDVRAHWYVKHRRVGNRREDSKSEDFDEVITVKEGQIIIEVKIQSVTIGDLVRQIKLYRTYASSASYVVAVAFNVNEYYRSALERESITLVRLGERFQKWATDKHDASPVKLQEF